MNQIYKIAKRYGKGNRARTCAAAFLAALALTGVMGMSEVYAAETINATVVNTNVVNTNALNTKYNLTVGELAENGLMPFFVNHNGAFYAANNKFTVDKDGNVTVGKVTATEGEIGNVVLNNGVFTGNSKLRDGELLVGDASGSYSQITPNSAKLGQVTIDEKGNIAGANSIQTNALNAKYNLSVGTANANGIMPFFVNSNGAFYAANGKLVVDKDGKVTATAGEIGNVVLNNGVFTGNSKLSDGELFVGDASGNYSQITPNSAKLGQVTIDEKGNIAGVNSIQTNALNSKYNLSVGTANENGTMPFFVSSTGDFYAANNKFSVGKDGKVTATAGEIGGVTINKGISYKNTSLRDGSLYLGDDKGNYSQISPEYAKLGKVTIDKEGNVTGVKSINTNAINANAINAKYNLSVGTANENGTMPFFVNSNGAFYAANGKLVVDKDGKVTATAGEIGNVVLNNGVFTGNSKLRDGELFVGDASGNYSQITTKGAKLGKVIVAEDGKISGVAAGKADTDAVNVGQLKNAVADAVKDAAKASDVGNIGDIHKELQNKDGSKTTVVDAVNNLDNKVGDLKYSAVTKGDINDGDSSTTAIGKLNQKLSGVAAVAGQHSSVSTTDANIKIQEGTNAAGGKDYQLSLNPDQKLHSVTTGETKMDTNGISINGKTYVSKDGLNANGNKVTQVADGKLEKDSKDAVNGGQLYATNQLVKDNASNISLLGNSIDKLDNRVNKVGAGAAALAALHPLDFDPEDKWDFAAGYGNYSGASAVALGAYYRPNEDTMFSVGGSFGNGENMVNAGVSLKLGQSNRAPASKAAMEKKISALSQEVEELKAAIADLRAAQTKAKDATEKDAQKK